MITFDKLKLVSSLDTFRIMNDAYFTKIVKNEELIGLEYQVTNPYLLRNQNKLCKTRSHNRVFRKDFRERLSLSYLRRNNLQMFLQHQ